MDSVNICYEVRRAMHGQSASKQLAREIGMCYSALITLHVELDEGICFTVFSSYKH